MASLSAAVSGTSAGSQASGPRAGPLSAPLDRGRALPFSFNKAGVLSGTPIRDLSLRSARAEAPRANSLLVARAAVATEAKTVMSAARTRRMNGTIVVRTQNEPVQLPSSRLVPARKWKERQC